MLQKKLDYNISTIKCSPKKSSFSTIGAIQVDENRALATVIHQQR